MVNSCATVSIPAIPPTLFLRAVNMVVARNAALVPPHDSPALLYIRPVAFACDAHLALTTPKRFCLAVYVAPATAYHGVAALAQDALVMEHFDRAAPHGTGNAKVGGNYAPVIRWQEDAKARGFGMTLHLDSRTQSEVEEFSTSGFVGVRREDTSRGFVLVVPNSGSIVESVTSDSVLALAKAKGWGVEKRIVSLCPLFASCCTDDPANRFISPNSDTSLRSLPLGRRRRSCRSSLSRRRALGRGLCSTRGALGQGHVRRN